MLRKSEQTNTQARNNKINEGKQHMNKTQTKRAECVHVEKERAKNQ
jgi:hypothetical protein